MIIIHFSLVLIVIIFNKNDTITKEANNNRPNNVAHSFLFSSSICGKNSTLNIIRKFAFSSSIAHTREFWEFEKMNRTEQKERAGKQHHKIKERLNLLLV